MSQLREKVKDRKEEYSALWWMNCSQLIEYDETMANKEEELQALRDRVTTLERAHADKPPPTPRSVSMTVSGEAAEPVLDPGRSPSGSPSPAIGGHAHTASIPRTRVKLSSVSSPLPAIGGHACTPASLELSSSAAQ